MTGLEIQRFAEGEGAEAGTGVEVDAGAEAAAEVDAKPEAAPIDVQAEINAAVAKAVKQLDAEYRKREAAAKKEAERLGKLSDDERQKAELENTRKELESQRLEFEREKLKYETTKVVAQRGLPVEFTEYLIAEDSEATLDRIKTFEKFYKKAVEDGVNEKLRGRAPASGGKTTENVNSGGSGIGFMEAIRAKQIAR